MIGKLEIRYLEPIWLLPPPCPDRKILPSKSDLIIVLSFK